jgi:hypothetical protein
VLQIKLDILRSIGASHGQDEGEEHHDHAPLSGPQPPLPRSAGQGSLSLSWPVFPDCEQCSEPVDLPTALAIVAEVQRRVRLGEGIPTFPDLICKVCCAYTRSQEISPGIWLHPHTCPTCGARGEIFFAKRGDR